MILHRGQPGLDLQGAAHLVAHVVIVHERQSKAMTPGEYGPVVTVLPTHDRGTIKRSTTLMRMSEAQLRRMQAAAPNLRGVPSYWCVRGDGAGEVWPPPDQDYDCELMGRNGKPIGTDRRKAVAVAPIEAYITGTAAAVAEQKRQMQQPSPQRVERFTLVGQDE